MKHITGTSIAAAATAALVLAISACGSSSSSSSTTAATTAKAVNVTSAWVRPTAPKAMNGVAYMTIDSAAGDKLTAVSVPSTVAASAELHETTGSGSMDSMKGMKQVSSIAIPSGKAVVLKPGGDHVMLIKLAKPIAAGDTVPLTLTFATGGTVKVDAVARDQ